MESSEKFDIDVTAVHDWVMSSSPPDAERECSCTEEKNQALEMENEDLKWKAEPSMNDEQCKSERQRVNKVVRNRDHQRHQLLHCKHELLVLSKKMGFQAKELRRESRQNEALREELESVRKELRSAKQRAFSQRAAQQRLKECLDQAIKDRDGLNGALLRCEKECSELRDKIRSQLSSANKKDGQCKRQTKEIHLLKLENQKLEKERQRKRSTMDSDAEGWRRELRKCEEELHAQKEKLEESKKCRVIADQIGKKILIIQQRSQVTRRPGQEAPLRQLESLQKEMLARPEELRKAQRLREELKEKLTEVAARLQLCQATVRDQREKLKAVTAERNMYRGQTEQLGVELADVKKGHHRKARTKITKRSSRDKSSSSLLSHTSPQSQPKTGSCRVFVH